MLAAEALLDSNVLLYALSGAPEERPKRECAAGIIAHESHVIWARVLALEVYQHTASVIGGHAPSILRLASDRLALAVGGLAPGINQRAITTLGTSMHSTFAQYRYLDQPSHDLDAITRQVNAIRHGSKRLRQQRGIGWYFVDKSDMTPPSAYSYDALIKRMRIQALRFH